MATDRQETLCNIGFRAKAAMFAVSLLLISPVLTGLMSDHENRSEREKRILASFPSIAKSVSVSGYFQAMAAFIDDHIGFVGPVNETYRKAQFYLFRDSPVANVDIGRDGFVFLNSHFPDKPYNRYRLNCEPDPATVRTTIFTLERLERAAMAAGLELTIALLPSKVLLYPERLPHTVPMHLRRACRALAPEDTLPALVEQGLKRSRSSFFFPFEELARHKDEPDFYPPGNFHANSQASHLFAQRMLEWMGNDPGPAFDRGGKTTAITADLDMLGFRREITAWTYPYESFGVKAYRRQPDWVRDYFPNTADFGMFMTAFPSSAKTGLLLTNSFGKYLAPHLAPGFKRLFHVNLNHVASSEIEARFESLVERTGASDLVILVQDAALPLTKLNVVAAAMEHASIAENNR